MPKLIVICQCWVINFKFLISLKTSGDNHFAGTKTYIWYGPEPAIFIQDPELLREAAQAITVFHKPDAGQFTRLLTPGLASYNGDKWAKHRKLINPVFNGEKLKVFSNVLCFSPS